MRWLMAVAVMTVAFGCPGCSRDGGIEPTDVIPPAAVTDLRRTGETANSISLAWTAPGDDGKVGTASQYDMRYSMSAITEANWSGATQCAGQPGPKAAGGRESLTVVGLLADTGYYFALKTADEIRNWSVQSNAVHAWTLSAPDTVAPAGVTDLVASGPTWNSMQLSWTAPGDDSSMGTASRYDIRYSTSSITEDNWASAMQCVGEPVPKTAGSTESFIVMLLSADTTYYFALKTADEIPNWSVLSDVPSARTAARDTSDLALVLVPAGTFTMGRSATFCGFSEHQVTLTHSFCLGKFAVTNREYCAALQWAYDAPNRYVTVTLPQVSDNLDGSTRLLVDLDGDCEIRFNGGFFSVNPGKDDYPMVGVTWYGAAAFCDWLSMRNGLERAYNHSTWQCNGEQPYEAEGYRLPTDAEWERAARYDDNRLYPWGDDEPNCQKANYAGCVGSTTPVGSYAQGVSKLGLYDMAGNVMEWCNDWYLCDLGRSSQTDPTGPGSGSYRVARGGMWNDDVDACLRCAYRGSGMPLGRGDTYGFRCARSQ